MTEPTREDIMLDYARETVQEDKRREAKGNGPLSILPPPQVPMAVARLFVAERCTYEETLTLRHWRGIWWQWRSSHWCELEDRAVRSPFCPTILINRVGWTEGQSALSWPLPMAYWMSSSGS
jgi:hypothetical protein